MKQKYIETGRKKQKLKTRDKILSGAQKFLNKGQNFTLEDIARETGLSRATIYRYYSNVEILSIEAGLDLNTKSPEDLYEGLKNLQIHDIILSIQDYYNHFTIDNEPAFRKYLSVVITAESPESLRGARRNQALQLALTSNDLELDATEIKNLINIATLLMGMEALIVSKDVCRLDNQKSMETLKWGLEMVLKGVLAQKE